MKTLIVSDVHANLAALEAVLDAQRSWDRFVFLGDAVLAGPQPDEVLSLLREVADVCLMGNHDREVLSLDMDEPVSSVSGWWKRWHRESISAENLEFMSRFLESTTIEEQGSTIQFDHGVLPQSLGKRLWPDSESAAFDHLAEMYSTS